MEHLVYTDYRTKEMELLLAGKKTIIVRGAAGRKLPHGRVFAGDTLYFINNNGEGLIKAKAKVKDVFNSEKLTKEESESLIDSNSEKHLLSGKPLERFRGKRYLVFITVEDVKPIKPKEFDKSSYSTMDDWLILE